jgi:hypothetical protein
MKHLVNSTKLFIETLERQARKVSKDPVTGKPVIGIKDKNLYDIYNLYKTGEIKFQDHAIEIAAFTGGSKSIDFISEGDNRVIGIRSIANAKLSENEYFCPVAVTMLVATGVATSADADMQAADYVAIDNVPQACNGWLDLKINDVEYLFRELPTSKFLGLDSNGADAPKGTHFLDNLAIMKPQFRNEILLKTGVNMPAQTAVKIILHGTRTTPKGK